MNSRTLNILLLIFLAGFLVLPKICLAEDFKDITPDKIEKYLELPEKDAQNLLFTLKQVFTTDWIYRESEGYSTGEERLVPLVLRKAVTLQALNHLLIEAPIEITFGIIKNATKIARLFLTQDPKLILEELERQSVQRAINYGMSTLLENEIRITPGVIEFSYISQKGEQRKVIFQYVLIYQPADKQRGKVAIRFYSPNSIDPPSSEGSYGGMRGTPNDLRHSLSPFTVEITGSVEKDEFNSFWWIDEKGRRLTEGPNPTLIQPSVKIDFSQPVPDLGIKPLSFWERNVLKPIKTTIKEVEIIITKLTGGSTKIVENLSRISKFATDVWNAIKTTVSKFNPFGAGVNQPLSSFIPEDEEVDESEPFIEPLGENGSPQASFEEEKKGIGGPIVSLNEAQEQLDDIAEQFDILDAETAKLIEEKGAKLLENGTSEKEEERSEEEFEEEEIGDSEGKEETESQDICSVNSVDINTAAKEDLQKIIGVGPTISQRIIEAKPFYSLSDLTRVRGIGEITLQKIILQGCAYVSGYVGGGGGGGSSGGGGGESSPTYLKILISEIQISPIEQRFIELYNPNDEIVNLTDWYIQRKTETGTSWASLISSTHFEGKTIQPTSHFLIASSTDADIFLELTLTDSNSLVLKNPNREISDLLGWGNAQDFETATATSLEQGKSLGRKWSTTTGSYLDTDNNQNDFESQTPTPKAQNQSPEPEPEPPPEESLLTIVINEIAWMGTGAESSDEWIELYNNSSSTADLNNWTLTWSHATSTHTITFSSQNSTTTISGYGSYLIERTDDNTVSDISADWLGSFGTGLNNDGEKLELRNDNNNLIDLVDCSSGWFAGTSSPNYISMERIDPYATGTLNENWANNNLITRNGTDSAGNPINGTPGAQNSVYQSLAPSPVSDFAIETQNSSYNIVALTWSSSTDSDTLTENLIYKIYYSREGEINEDNLGATSTLSATTSAAPILISDLYYDSAYYFGIKVFDGQNYSSLATITPWSIPSALIDSPWTMFGGSFQRSNQSENPGPSAVPTIFWTYDEDNNPSHPDLNPLYTPPIIRPEGTIFSSVIYPAAGQGILALNPDGSKKSFQEETIENPLVLQTDGSVLADDKKTKDSQGNTYLAEGNALKKIDSQGSIIWQRDFEFVNPYSCSTSTPEATSPTIGENGIIYVAVKNNSCNQNGDDVDYLYLVSAENGILGTVNLSGYRSSLPSVSSSGIGYISYLIYGAGPPHLYLSAVSAVGTILWAKQVVSNYDTWQPSPILIDSQENLYFVVGKDVFAWDKDGNELWKIYLGENVPANWYVGDIGIVLDDDGTLYLSGRGAILALK